MIPLADNEISLEEAIKRLNVIILQIDRLTKGLTLTENGRIAISPIVQPVVMFDVDGKPAAGLGADGKQSVTETSGSAISNQTLISAYNTFIARTSPTGTVGLADRAYNRIPIRKVASGIIGGAGTITFDLVAGYGGGWKTCIRIVGISMDGAAGGDATLTFTDGAAGACDGLRNGAGVIPAASLPAGVVFKGWEDIFVWDTIGNSKMQLTFATVAGDAGKVASIYFEYWYEPI